ncbi:MAG: DUF6526 family protein [Acidobacteriota bacterium]|nr:DUF6526 family protein [Acidobacteriota bacterium]
MPEQSYSNHTKLAPPFHFVLAPLTVAVLIGSLVNLYKSLGDHERLYNASLICAMAVALFLLAFLARVFALRAQDRAIRAEENLRHFALTGRLLDARLTLAQIIGLRFASDAEFPALASRAAAEGLSLDQVKKSVKNWRADNDRL